MNISLKGKNALVCGSTQGIGKAIAIELASLGANVFLFARNEESLKTVSGELPVNHSQEHGFLVADFHDPEKVREAIFSLTGKGTVIHILVNNTGGPAPGNISEADTGDFIKAFVAHLINNQQLVQALLPGMKKSGYGRIINIISTSVKVPIPGLGVSNTIRGAVAGWAKTLANELGPYGITVNNVLPGFTATQRLESLFERRAVEAGITREEYTAQAVAKIPARRLADPMETAAAVGFLASPSASYINGINLPVDGGNTPCL